MDRMLDPCESIKYIDGIRTKKLLSPEKMLLDRYVGGRFVALASVLGMSFDEFLYSSGCNDFVTKGHEKLLTKLFRYCPECLRGGFHSILHQHVALGYCPQHRCLLHAGCQRCGFKFAPTWESVAQHPFACMRCGALLIHTISSTGDAREIEGAAKKIESLRKLMKTSGPDKSLDHPCFSRGACEATRYDRASSAYRQIARHLNWEEDSSSTEQRRQLAFRLDGSDGEPRDGQSVSRAISNSIYATLDNISRISKFDESLLSRTMHMMSIKGSGARLCVEASLVHISVAKLIYIYGASSIMRGVAAGFGGGGQPLSRGAVFLTMRGAFVAASAEASRIVAEYEVVGLFAAILMSIRSLKRLDEMDWREIPRQEDYFPSWCYFVNNNILMLRPRADWRTLEGLIGRYSKMILPI